MSKLIIMKGLPGSGKTTWAKQYQRENPKTKRVNRDELRAMLDDSVWSKGNEKFVVDMEEMIAETALIEGYNVIVDDTNLNPKNEKRWRDLAEKLDNDLLIPFLGKTNSCEFEIKELATELDECIRRDALRKGRAHVGKGVILNFYNQYVKQTEK